MSLSKTCSDFVSLGNPIDTSKWRSSNDRFVTNKLFRYFNEYDEFTEMKSTWMCEKTTYAAMGIRKEKGRNICHIAYQKSELAPSSQPVYKTIERIADTELTLKDETEEVIENAIGVTKIKTQNFCFKGRTFGNLSLVSVELTPTSLGDVTKFREWRQNQGPPVQHMFFTNDQCYITTE